MTSREIPDVIRLYFKQDRWRWQRTRPDNVIISRAPDEGYETKGEALAAARQDSEDGNATIEVEEPS